MNAVAIVHLNFQSEEHLIAMFDALNPETTVYQHTRSKVKITKKDNVLTLKFEASDTSALRASFNSYMHWIYLIDSILNSV